VAPPLLPRTFIAIFTGKKKLFSRNFFTQDFFPAGVEKHGWQFSGGGA